VHQEGPVGHLAHVDAGQRADRVGDLPRVVLVAGVEADVDDHGGRVRLHHVERGHHAADPADGHGEVAGGAGRSGYLDPRDDGVSGTGCGHEVDLTHGSRGDTVRSPPARSDPCGGARRGV
jgi:hypothetical protein